MNSNQVVGGDLAGARITFKGQHNILVVEDGANVNGCVLTFYGDANTVFIPKSRFQYRLNLSLFRDSLFSIGPDCFMNGTLNVSLSERRHVIIGRNSLISYSVSIRTSDPHLLYDIDSKLRLNPSKSVFVGHHTWIGQNVLLLKGTAVSSGCVVGASSVLANKTTGANEAWAGNPARRVRSGVFFDSASVHMFDQVTTEASLDYADYSARRGVDSDVVFTHLEPITFEALENRIDSTPRDERIELGKELVFGTGSDTLVFASK